MCFLRLYAQLDSLWYDCGIMCTVIESFWMGCCVKSLFWVVYRNWKRALVLFLLTLAKPLILVMQTC